MEDVHVARLKTLADALDRMPETQFDIGDWKSECGTVCCAVGLAGDIPEFQSAGFSLRKTGDSDPAYFPIFGEISGFSAVELFFGLGYSEVRWVFVGVSYPDPAEVTPGDVARRIRALLADKGFIAGAGV